MAAIFRSTWPIKSSIRAGRYLLRLITVVVFFWGIFLLSFPVMASEARQTLTTEQLLSLDSIKTPIPMTAFSVQGEQQVLKDKFQGRLVFSSDIEDANLQLSLSNEHYRFEKRTRPGAFTPQRKTLPEISIEFVQLDNKIIPYHRDLQITEHPHWDYFIGVGKIWKEAEDVNYSRIALPFSLVEKNQNCVHNGVLSFLIDANGQTTNYYYQISSETCLYYKVDMWGQGAVSFQYLKNDKANDSIKKYNSNLKNQLTNKPIKALNLLNSTIKLDKIALSATIKPTDMTNFGVIYEGVHYSSQCQTRHGDYPFCQQLVLPSYSTAKSIFAGVGMLFLIKKFPSIFEEKVSKWVPECQGEDWQDVTFGHLLNMSTGNFQSLGHSTDEDAEHSQIFFKAASHQEKINYSCHQFSKQSPAGINFVYHTSDTYLLGTALNAFVNKNMNSADNNQSLDFYDVVFKQSLWPALQLSPIIYSTRRTADKSQHPFTGYGLFFTQGDLATLSHFLMNDQTISPNLLNMNKLSQTLSNKTTANDMPSQYPFIHYINGFWKQNVTTLLQCKKETWLPYMLGYGGITIVLANKNLQYYFVSDSGQYIWRDAIKELNNITSLCRQ
ncbi:MAG: hypothetical protein ACI9YH_000372 [Colwellia sp.]|jgi:hypothetical protein